MKVCRSVALSILVSGGGNVFHCRVPYCILAARREVRGTSIDLVVGGGNMAGVSVVVSNVTAFCFTRSVGREGGFSVGVLSTCVALTGLERSVGKITCVVLGIDQFVIEKKVLVRGFSRCFVVVKDCKC